MFKNIKRLTAINEQRKHINRLFKKLYQPLMLEHSFIVTIWEICDKELPDMPSTLRKQVFLTIVLLYYAPQKLTGGKIPKPVMRTICEVTNSQQSLISHHSENLIFHYEIYEERRNAVDHVNQKVMDAIVEQGLTDKESILNYLALYLS